MPFTYVTSDGVRHRYVCPAPESPPPDIPLPPLPSPRTVALNHRPRSPLSYLGSSTDSISTSILLYPYSIFDPPIHFQDDGENDRAAEGSDDEEHPCLREGDSLVIEEYDSQADDSDKEVRYIPESAAELASDLTRQGSSSAYACEHEIARPEYAYLFHCIPGPELRRKKGLADLRACYTHTRKDIVVGELVLWMGVLFLLAAVGSFGLEKAEVWGCVASVMLVGFGLVAGGRVEIQGVGGFHLHIFFSRE